LRRRGIAVVPISESPAAGNKRASTRQR
jgi:hypothetical protein